MGYVATVRAWSDEEGWGVLDSDQTAGGCWVHYSSIELDGYRTLQVGSTVEFEFERAEQDGFHFRATAVWIPGSPRTPVVESPTNDGAYRSTLTITLSDGTVLSGDAAHDHVRASRPEDT